MPTRGFKAAVGRLPGSHPLAEAVVVLRHRAGAREASGQLSRLGDGNICFRLLLAGQSEAATATQGAHRVLPLSTEGTDTRSLPQPLLGNISFLFSILFVLLV